MDREKIDRLERHILQLSSQFFVLKQEFFALKGSSEKMAKHFDTLKYLLEEKEIILEDDLEVMSTVLEDLDQDLRDYERLNKRSQKKAI
jgi:hypothetical protein